jgi:hypothetical protein
MANTLRVGWNKTIVQSQDEENMTGVLAITAKPPDEKKPRSFLIGVFFYYE